MRRRKLGVMAGTAAMMLTSGCMLSAKHPHNDVMVFATHTKFGVDISAPLNSATLPQINVGYNRAEAVWMPLRPNGLVKDNGPADEHELIARLQKCDDNLKAVITEEKPRQSACLAAVLPHGKYVSMSSGVSNDIGGEGVEIDTYSVFASFGAKGGVSGSGANGGLAQVFATGIAAQRLASNPQVGQALNTAAPSAAAAVANAEAAEANQKTEQLRQFGMTATEPLRGSEMLLMAEIRQGWKCGWPDSDKPNFGKIMDHANTAKPQALWLALKAGAGTKAVVESALEKSTSEMMQQFIDSRKAVCGG